MLEEAEDTPRRMDDVTAELAEQLERWSQRMMETTDEGKCRRIERKKEGVTEWIERKLDERMYK